MTPGYAGESAQRAIKEHFLNVTKPMPSLTGHCSPAPALYFRDIPFNIRENGQSRSGRQNASFSTRSPVETTVVVCLCDARNVRCPWDKPRPGSEQRLQSTASGSPSWQTEVRQRIVRDRDHLDFGQREGVGGELRCPWDKRRSGSEQRLQSTISGSPSWQSEARRRIVRDHDHLDFGQREEVRG